MTVRILQGDCREVLATLEADSFDACVTDPPYHLTTGKKGGSGEASVNPASPAGRALVTTGFMGMQWDGGDVAFRPETWAEVLRVMKPGAYLLAFGGTRTYHRLVCAIEDAGFEVRNMVAWLYGSGFPKGTDKAKIPEAWKGWNTALKPAIEPICLARKPMVGTLAENLQRYGTGALWIDGCRIGETVETWPTSRSYQRAQPGAPSKGTQEAGETPPGRWPANVLHDGSEEVLAAFPQATGQKADLDGDEPSSGLSNVYEGSPIARGAVRARLDTGSAARFFYCAKADRADRNEGLDGMADVARRDYRTGNVHNGHGGRVPDKVEKNHHPTVKPTDLMRYLCRLVTPPGGQVLDPFLGSGSTLKAAELEGFAGTGIELSPEYVAIARRRIAADAPLFAAVS
jgi:site-specific DNA-methyltransferase (adenine-specific)